MDRNSAQADEKAFRSAALHLGPLNPQRGERRFISGSYGYRIPWVNQGATIFWHTDRIPDDDPLTKMRGDLFALQGDMEFLAANVARLRTGLFVMTLHTVRGRPH